MLSFFPRGVLDEILNLIESVSEDFSSYFSRADFSDQFRKVIMRYKRIGCIKVMRQSCLVIDPFTVDNFASRLYCTPVGRASDSMMGPT